MESQHIEGHLAGRPLAGDAAAIIDVAKDAATIQHVDIVDGAAKLLRGDQNIRVEDLERFMPTPRRMTGTVRVFNVASFSAYVDRHKGDASKVTIWVPAAIPSTGAPVLVAVLNDHADEPHWGDHRAHLELQVTDAWKHWTQRDGTLMDQEAFAEHIEDGLTEIAEPDGAQLLEIVQTLHQKANVSAKSGVRLSDGRVQFEYVEDLETKAGQDGTLTVPDTFDLMMAPFLGEEKVHVIARLRYRIRAGKVTIGYKLDRPSEHARDALERIADGLRQDAGPAVLIGAPR